MFLFINDEMQLFHTISIEQKLLLLMRCNRPSTCDSLIIESKVDLIVFGGIFTHKINKLGKRS